MVELKGIETEKRNKNTENIDTLDTFSMLRLINSEDKKVAYAVSAVLPQIAEAVDVIYEKMKQGGRLVYCGCGTSGRLGVLDAVECPPTFGVDYNTVVAIIAGGDEAFVKAAEGAEDEYEGGERDLKAIAFTSKDVLVGIAASGRTPYVLGAMDYAKKLGAPVIGLTCNRHSKIDVLADIGIAPMPGQEVVTGSTRLKSGTAQKMVLNMISTAVMIKLGKVYHNLMVDVKTTNEKLRARAVSIVCEAAGVTEDEAAAALKECDYSAKTAILMLIAKIGSEEAEKLLEKNDGVLAKCL